MGQTHEWKEITLEDNADVWDKEQSLVGVLANIEENVGPNDAKMYVIQTEDKTVKVWGSTVLDDKLMSVPRGTTIKLEYLGKQKGKNGSYHNYKVFMDLNSNADDIKPSDIPF